MRFVTPVDRVIQAGGKRVTLLFWLIAVLGAVVLIFTDLPVPVALSLSGGGTTIYWMRLENITIADLLRRIVFTRARHGGD